MQSRILLLIVCAVLASPVNLHARPAHKRALADHYGSFLNARLNSCQLCHLAEKGGGDKSNTLEDRPHNVFGARLAELRRELRKQGKKSDISARLEAIAQEDTDKDGVPNIIEILSGHLPSDATDKPHAAEAKSAAEKLAQFREKQREYAWKPFEPVVRPAPPKKGDMGWIRNPIDAFLAAEYEKQGLKPRPEASRTVLIRRLYLDLIGLPPTPGELQAFLNDKSPDAYEKLVDRLLASPHHGERWGRHWMDVWRYSDWYGYRQEIRNSQPHIWRWRDWIIESVNEDKPYNRMIVEMLAGDELAPEDPKVLRATGFLARNWYKFNRSVWLDNTIEHTGKAFLGVTLNCARCHDHFFDPFTQKEYYQFRAIFEPHTVRIDPLPGEMDTGKNGMVRVYDSQLDPKTFLFIRGEEKNPDKKAALEPTIPAALGGDGYEAEPVPLPPGAIVPQNQPWYKKQLLQQAEKDLADVQKRFAKVKAGEEAEAKASLQAARTKLEALQALLQVEDLELTRKAGPELEQARMATSRAQQRAALADAELGVLLAKKSLASAAQAKSNKEKQTAVAEKKLAAAEQTLAKAKQALGAEPTAKYTPRKVTSYPATSTGRRLALARWIAEDDNPLTARVAVNHIWLRHFGKPLVPSVFDFGGNGKKPTHPALLDWLAAELVKERWSMKALHKLIVTSAAYRMESTDDAVNAKKDPDNLYLWRMNPKRMEAEIVRDSVLAVSGNLDRTFGGPELDEDTGLSSQRRSIYYRYAPEKMMTFLTLFDSPSVNECYQRSESIVPQQALAMANNTLVLGQSRLLARKLTSAVGEASKENAARFIDLAFRHILGRSATEEEISLCRQFLDSQHALFTGKEKGTPFASKLRSAVAPSADPELRARENLVHVLFNHNEFITIR